MTVRNDDSQKENLTKQFMFLREAFAPYHEKLVDRL